MYINQPTTPVVNPASFVLDNQINFQSNSDWSIDEAWNRISKESISSLRVKYEILSSIELRKLQTSELASQPFLEAALFIHIFSDMVLGCHYTLFLGICLSTLNALAQLCPNNWCAMIDMYVAWKLRDLSGTTFSLFQRVYQLVSLLWGKNFLFRGLILYPNLG